MDAGAPAYDAVAAVIDDEPRPPLVPAAVLGEVGYLAERRYGTRAVDAFLAGLDSGAVRLDCGEEDIGRARELVRRYADLNLGVTTHSSPSARSGTAVVCSRSTGAISTCSRASSL